MAEPGVAGSTPIPMDARIRRALAHVGYPARADDIQGVHVITTKPPVMMRDGKFVGRFLGIVPVELCDSLGRWYRSGQIEELAVRFDEKAPDAEWFRFLHPLRVAGDSPSYAALARGLSDETVRAEFADIGLRLVGCGQYGPSLYFSAIDAKFRPADVPKPGGGVWDGSNVVVGIVDAGCDFAHPNLRDAGGNPRIVRLIDQKTGGSWDAAWLAQQLATADPYATYDPEKNGFAMPGTPAHGTHVADIAAGNGFAPGSWHGVARGADVAFVHIRVNSDWKADFTQLRSAVAALFAEAGSKPCVVNISLGDNTGPHSSGWFDASELDRAIDPTGAGPPPGRAVVVSAGNYHRTDLHVRRRLNAAATRAEWRWQIAADDPTANIAQIWHDGAGDLTIELRSPDGATLSVLLPLTGQSPVMVGATPVGLMLRTASAGVVRTGVEIELLAPTTAVPSAGLWTVAVVDNAAATRCVDAWLVRDLDPARDVQSRFVSDDPLDDQCTLGQLSCARHVIVAGAHVGCAPPVQPLFPASSAGPTRDGFERPDVTAPGTLVHAACSKGGRSVGGQVRPMTVAMSGTSMAAPHVTGVVALMLQKNPQLKIEDIRQVLRDSADHARVSPGSWDPRRGCGYLDASAALQATP